MPQGSHLPGVAVGHHLAQHASQRPHVGLAAVRLASVLLGRHVQGRAQARSREGCPGLP